MERAFSTLALRGLDEEQRTFVGTATAPSPDRVGDVVEPLGCRFRNPTVLLHQHRHDAPIGEVRFDRPTSAGVGFTAKIPKIAEPGPLRDRVDTAWGEVKHGLVRAVSIGFVALATEPLPTGGLRIKKCEIVELSTVSVPAQAAATINVVKSIDAAIRRGEAPAAQLSSGPLWDRLARIGRAALAEVEAGESFKKLGQFGPQVSGVRSLQEMVRTLANHVDDLEARLTASPVEYRGVWQAGETYPARTFITFSGSVWYTGKATSRRPGEGVDWVLACKRGADAKERT
jgi:hypothetical protein